MKTKKIDPRDVKDAVLDHLGDLIENGVWVGISFLELEKYDNESFHKAFSKEMRKVRKLYRSQK